MKNYRLLTLLISLFFSIPLVLNSQQLFCEDYDMSTGSNLWFSVGGPALPAPNCNPNSGVPGTISFAGNQLSFVNFKPRQTQTVVTNIAGIIPNNNPFRVELEYTMTNSNASSPLLVLSLMEVAQPVRIPTTVSGITTWAESNGNTIEIRITSNGPGNNNGYRFFGSSRFNNVRGVNSNNILLGPNAGVFGTTYYLRLERLNNSTVELSVFSNPARTALVGATCFQIDPNIQDLEFIGHGGLAGAGCVHQTNSVIDNLCVFGNLVSTVCTSNCTTPLSLSFNSSYNCQAKAGSVVAIPAGGTGPYTYLWNTTPPATTQTISSVPPGNYTVTVTDANGCTLSASTTLYNTIWPKHPTTTGTSNSRGRGIDVSNGRYLTGQFKNTISFNVGNSDPINYPVITLNSNTTSNSDGYIVKYDDCGALWAFGFGSTANGDEGRVIRRAIDPIGEEMIVGARINGPIPGGIIDATGAATSITSNAISVDLTTQPIQGIPKGVIMSVDPSNGAINWVYIVGENPNHPTLINDVRTDGSTIYAVGRAKGDTLTLDWDVHLMEGKWDALLLNIDKNGGNYTLGNSTTWGTVENDDGEAIDIDRVNRYVMATGYVSYDQVRVNSFNGVIYTHPGSAVANDRDMFVAQYSIWQPSLNNFQVYRSNGKDQGMDISSVTSSNGNTDYIVSGYFENQLVFGGSNPNTHFGVGVGNEDAYIVGLDQLLDRTWSADAIGPGLDIGEALAYDAANNVVYIAGEYSNLAVGFLLGSSTTGSPSDIDNFVTSFDVATGTQGILKIQSGDGASDRAYDLELNGDEIFTTGQFGNFGNMLFPGGNPSSLSVLSNSRDTYFARLDYGLNFFRKKGKLAIEENKKAKSFMDVYPNPTTNQFTVELNQISNSQLRVIDISGKLIFEKQNIPSGFSQEIINMSTFPSGIYFVRLISGENVETVKLIKQ